MFGTIRSLRTTRTNRLVVAALSSALALALLLALGGCGGKTSTPAPTEPPVAGGESQSAFPVTVTDDSGREVTIESEPMRIVSLAPANTEIVAALGLLDRLVGVTSVDDYPAEVADIDVVGDFAGPNLEAVAAAKPDLVLATGGIQADVITQLEDLGAVVVAVDPADLDALFSSIEMVGKVTGTPGEAAELMGSMRSDLDDVREAVSGETPVPVFLEIAQDPLFTAGPGTLLHDLIITAGGANIVTEQGYVAYSVEQLVAEDPVVYLATRGSMSNPEDLASRTGYSDITAVRTGRIYILDDNLVSRPGPRVVEGVRQIAEALHPDAF